MRFVSRFGSDFRPSDKTYHTPLLYSNIQKKMCIPLKSIHSKQGWMRLSQLDFGFPCRSIDSRLSQAQSGAHIGNPIRPWVRSRAVDRTTHSMQLKVRCWKLGGAKLGCSSNLQRASGKCSITHASSFMVFLYRDSFWNSLLFYTLHSFGK